MKKQNWSPPIVWLVTLPMLPNVVSVGENSPNKMHMTAKQISNLAKEVGVDESVESDVSALLKTSEKSLTSEDLAELGQSTREKFSKDGVMLFECDFIIKGLGEAPGERDEALELSKHHPFDGFIMNLDSAAKDVRDLCRIYFIDSQNWCTGTMLIYVVLNGR